MKYVVCGLMARMMAEMALARSLADQRKKLLLFYHPTPDVTEVTMFLGVMASAKITVIDAANSTSIDAALDGGVEDVLITNGDSLLMSFQLRVGDPDFRWPNGWSVLASGDGGMLMMPRGPWAACFAANAVYRSKSWRNISQRSKSEVVEMARELFNSFVTDDGIFSVAPNSFESIENLIRARTIRSAGDILDLATAACIAARQEQRMMVTAADVVTAIAVKSRLSRRTPTATPDQATASTSAS